MELGKHEINPQFDMNQPNVSTECSRMAYCNKEMYPQYETNQRFVSSEHIHNEYCNKDVIPQVNGNPRTVANADENHSLVGRISSQQFTRLNEKEFEQQKLDSVESFKKVEMKYANARPLQQMNANIYSTTQNKLQNETFHNKTFLFNSPFKKHSNVDSKQTTKECDNSRRCDRCNLDFIDFEQYLDHEYKSCNATQMTKNEARTLENLFHTCKMANKSHIGNISVNEEKNKILKTESSLEFGSLHFDSNDYSANHLRYHTLNESATSQTRLDDLESYLEIQLVAHQPNLLDSSISSG
ncbi:hypothetical protein TNIN_312741 [Trichonephila inaurata madagascariensis]|uniref:Uncharacterized protein n=1 Tax=Trichonephila inaurata madagascariensis TaxID=2747483 RepID=A0A8X6YRB6_9ARAC|nr:hypothetical protein TNIN_312741 [Trichonephila inaurata madagascariensis]